ncbi:MAG: hypothetical protein ABEH56_04220 [Salinirussus sp.]
MTDTNRDERSADDGSTESAAELSSLLTALQETEQREDGGTAAGSTRARDRLLRAVAKSMIAEPAAAADSEPFDPFLRALTPDLDEETRQVVSEALFAVADRRADAIAGEIEVMYSFLDTDEPAVAAWTAGTLGRVAETHPDAVVPAASDLAGLVECERQTVQHNAVEALATLSRERPDAVAPATDALRTLLSHSDVAIQHNAAGIFGVLAATHPDAVAPAAETIADLRSHDEQAVRNVAAGTLARLAQERPDVVESVTDTDYHTSVPD